MLATIKVLAIVTVHVLGVIAAHDKTIEVLPPRHQVTGHQGGLQQHRPGLGPGLPRLDVLGALLVTAATGTAIYAMIDAGESGWLEPSTWACSRSRSWATCCSACVNAPPPLMDLSLLFRRPAFAGVFTIGIATALMVAVFFLGSFYLQQVADLGPLATGLLFLPVALFTMADANLGGRLIGRTGGRSLGVAGLAVAAIGLAVPALWPTTVGVVVGISLGAAGIGGLFVVAAATALGNVAPHEAGIASGVLSTFHEFDAASPRRAPQGWRLVALMGGSHGRFASPVDPGLRRAGSPPPPRPTWRRSRPLPARW